MDSTLKAKRSGCDPADVSSSLIYPPNAGVAELEYAAGLDPVRTGGSTPLTGTHLYDPRSEFMCLSEVEHHYQQYKTHCGVVWEQSVVGKTVRGS